MWVSSQSLSGISRGSSGASAPLTQRGAGLETGGVTPPEVSACPGGCKAPAQRGAGADRSCEGMPVGLGWGRCVAGPMGPAIVGVLDPYARFQRVRVTVG